MDRKPRGDTREEKTGRKTTTLYLSPELIRRAHALDIRVSAWVERNLRLHVEALEAMGTPPPLGPPAEKKPAPVKPFRARVEAKQQRRVASEDPRQFVALVSRLLPSLKGERLRRAVLEAWAEQDREPAAILPALEELLRDGGR